MLDRSKLFDLYERLYFHEISMRESLSARMQTPLAIIVALAGVFAFVLDKFDKDAKSWAAVWFWILLGAAFATLVVSVVYFIKSWYNHTYSFVPTPEELNEYRDVLLAHYAEEQDSDDCVNEAMKEALFGYYMSSATVNTRCNDKRSILLHKTNSFVILASTLTLVMFLVFYFGGLDKPAAEIVIVKPVKIEG